MFVLVFVLFWKGDDVCCFPDGGDDVFVERHVVECDEVLCGCWSEVLQVPDVDVVWAE